MAPPAMRIRGIELLRSLAEEHGVLLRCHRVLLRTRHCLDQRVLARTFELRDIDPARIAVAGFSDGASYSLSVGLANGDFFSAIFGFSPGFIVPGEFKGKPPVFISHGTIDPILPIDDCSRRIVPN